MGKGSRTRENISEVRKDFFIGLIIGLFVFAIQKGFLSFVPAPFFAIGLTRFIGYLAVSLTLLTVYFQTLLPARYSMNPYQYAFLLGFVLPYDLYTIYGILY